MAQLKSDLYEMGVVGDLKRLDREIVEWMVVETMTAGRYVERVFDPDCLPAGSPR